LHSTSVGATSAHSRLCGRSRPATDKATQWRGTPC
jgi:hypothetical protein